MAVLITEILDNRGYHGSWNGSIVLWKMCRLRVSKFTWIQCLALPLNGYVTIGQFLITLNVCVWHMWAFPKYLFIESSGMGTMMLTSWGSVWTEWNDVNVYPVVCLIPRRWKKKIQPPFCRWPQASSYRLSQPLLLLKGSFRQSVCVSPLDTVPEGLEGSELFSVVKFSLLSSSPFQW